MAGASTDSRISALGLNLSNTFVEDPAGDTSDLMPVVPDTIEELLRWGIAHPFGMSERDKKYFDANPDVDWYLRPATDEEVSYIDEVTWRFGDPGTPANPFYAVFVLKLSEIFRLLFFVCFVKVGEGQLTERCMLTRTLQPKFSVLFDPTEY